MLASNAHGITTAAPTKRKANSLFPPKKKAKPKAPKASTKPVPKAQPKAPKARTKPAPKAQIAPAAASAPAEGDEQTLFTRAQIQITHICA